MKFRKIVRILEKGKLSYHDNIDYNIELECGHRTVRTFHKGVNPLGREVGCCQCKVTEGSFEEKLEKAPHLKQCSNCGNTWKPRAQRKGSKERQQRCPKCHTRNL